MTVRKRSILPRLLIFIVLLVCAAWIWQNYFAYDENGRPPDRYRGDIPTITGTSEVEVYAGESADSLSKIEKDGDSYPVSGKTHFKLFNPSSGAITITGIWLSKNDPGSTPSTPSGCYGSIGGSIAAAVVVLLAISALVVVRRKKNNA